MKIIKNLSTSIFTGFLIILALSSCTQSQPEAVITETVQPLQTSLPPTPTLSLTRALLPTYTIAPTATLTPNFSPPIATKTSLPAATCPQINQNIAFNLTDFENNLQINTADDLEKAMEIAKNSLLTYMNAGGETEKLKTLFQDEQKKQKPSYLGNIQLGDVTGDGIPEIFVWLALPGSEEGLPSPFTIVYIKKFFPMPVYGTRTFVFGCNQRRYDFLGTIKDKYYGDAAMPTIADLNADGINEIIQPTYDFAGSGYAINMYILNWNGKEFTNSLHDELREDWMSSFSEGAVLDDVAFVRSGSFNLQDIDNNGTTEVVLSSDDFRGAQPCEILYRETKMVLMWNGDHYISFYWRTPPKYRIQAIWDGDHESVHDLINQALISYQKVLDDKTLLPWSLDYQNLAVPLCGDIPGSTPILANVLIDEDEAPKLQAYALYRIILLEIVQGDIARAEENYKLLQEDYQNAYQELAKLFWDKYSISKDISEACKAISVYTEVNQEKILYPLDRRTYGNFNSLEPVYQPDDICPYK